MSRLDHATALVASSKDDLDQLQAIYEDAVQSKIISSKLCIDVKNILENLRSALDYCANELYTRFVGGPKQDVYFPISPKGGKRLDFRGIVGKRIPMLCKKRPDLMPLLESLQTFHTRENEWLPDLATLCNKNKHDDFCAKTHQGHAEVELGKGPVPMFTFHGNVEVRNLSFQAPIRVAEASTVTLSRVRINDAEIEGPLTVEPGKPIAASAVQGELSVRDVSWYSIDFAEIKKPIIPFLQRAIAGTERIVQEIKKVV